MINSYHSIIHSIKNFESLKEEHMLILNICQQEMELMNEYEADLAKKDIPLIQHSYDKVNLGLGDANMLKLLSEYLKIIDAERHNHSTNILKLNEESNWLRDEVTNLQSNLRKSEERIVELEEENKHLKFLLELKSIDDKEISTQEKLKDSLELSKSIDIPEEGDFKFPVGEDENKGILNKENVTNPNSGTGFDLPPRLKTFHNLLIQYAAQGRYEVAIPLCKQTLEDLEKISGRNHPDVATMLNILELVYRDQNKFNDTLVLLKEALIIRENTLGTVHVAMLKLLSEYLKIIDAERHNHSTNILKLNEESNWLRDEVTNLQSNLRKSEERIVELEEENKHLKFLLELKSIDDKEISTQEKLKDSLELSKSIDIPEEGDFKFPDGEDENKGILNTENVTNPNSGTGFELPPRLKTLHNLVIQYAAQGRYEVAIPLCKQTLEDLEKTSGRNHPDVATMLNILALVYRDQNKFNDSLVLLKEALLIRENTLGTVHVAVAANLNNLAVLYGKQKKFNEAEPLCKRSLLIREELLGSDHPDVAKQLNNLALLCQNQGKYSEVEAYYKRAINIYTNAFGKQNEDVIKTKINLATAYMRQTKYKDAELVYKEIINEVHEQFCGEIAANNKPIWMLAEERQHGLVGGNFNTQRDEKESWERIHQKKWSNIFSPLKNLAALYRLQNKNEAADIVENFANENSQQHNDLHQNESTRTHNVSEKISIPRPSSMGQRSSSGYVGPDTWNVQRTNQMKTNLNMRPNNLNRNSGPVKPIRNSLVDNFTGKFYKTPYSKDTALTPSSGNQYFSNGDGRLKKASSMSQLPGAPNRSTSTQPIKIQQVNTGRSWLSEGRSSSIEDLKKKFGKRS